MEDIVRESFRLLVEQTDPAREPSRKVTPRPVKHGFGTNFEGTFQGNKVQLHVFQWADGWANFSLTTSHNYTLFLPDHGSVRELRANEIQNPLPQFMGKFGKYTGVYVNASAKDDATAEITEFIRGIAKTTGPDGSRAG